MYIKGKKCISWSLPQRITEDVKGEGKWSRHTLKKATNRMFPTRGLAGWSARWKTIMKRS